jgi:hypothetical protein
MNCLHIVYPTSFIVCTILLFGSGCATETVYVDRPSQTPKPIDTRQPTAWASEIREYSRPKFSISATFISNGDKLMIKGQVIESECLVAIRESRDIPEQRYSNSSWLQEWRTEKRTLEPTSYKWTPTSLRIQNPYGEESVARVEKDGSFSAILYSNGTVFFTKPELTKYLQATLVKASSAIVVPNGLPASLSTSTELALPDVYRIDVNRQFAQEYVKDHIADFTVVCYDQTSRTPIMPRIQVVVLSGPSREDITDLLAKEFGGNQELLRIGLETAEGLMWKEDKNASITQDMNFKTWLGASLKISATHPKYYYFEANLVVEKAGNIRKNILLIEKGSKIRVDSANEGQAGTMVDP